MNLSLRNLNIRQIARKLILTLDNRDHIFETGDDPKTVYLTFDDGPHPEHTPRLLNELRQHSAKATFFLVGQRCVEHPEILRQIVDEGHAIGSHTYHHTRIDSLNTKQLLEDIRQSDDTIEEYTGKKTALFRPPYGKVSLTSLLTLRKQRKKVVLWNVDPKDYAVDSPSELAEWFTNKPMQGGDIVLLHDVHPYAALALPSLLDDAMRRGLTFSAL